MIDVRNISKTFFVPHQVKALVDVTTKIAAGEVVVVIGPSGSGKSTFLRCLNHLETADAGGHILIDGIDILDRKTNINKVRAEVGMVFQSFNLFPHKTVLENITLAQRVVRKRPKEEAHTRAMTLLEKVGISDKVNAFPDNLSGGQQQRVAIARSLAMDPPILLADEPTGNLDSKSGEEIMALFNQLWEDGRTILMVTHDNKVAEYSQRTIRLLDGKVNDNESVH